MWSGLFDDSFALMIVSQNNPKKKVTSAILKHKKDMKEHLFIPTFDKSYSNHIH